MAESEKDLLIRIRGDVKDATDSISRLRGEFTSIDQVLAGLTSPIGMVTTGIGFLVAAATASTDKFLEQAKSARELAFETGFTAEQSHNLIVAFEKVGVPADAFRMAIMRMSVEIESGGKNLAMMGVNLRDNEGTLKTSGQIFVETITKLSQMSNAQERNALMVKEFGRGSSALIPVLEGMRDGTVNLDDELKKHNIFTEDSEKAAKKLQIQMAELKIRFSELENEIGSRVVPAVLKATESWSGFFEEIQKFIPAIVLVKGLFYAISSLNPFNEVKKSIPETAKAVDLVGKQLTHLFTQGSIESEELKDIRIRDEEEIVDTIKKLDMELLKARGKNIDADLLASDYWAQEQEKKVIAFYKMKHGATLDENIDWIKSLAKDNADAQAAYDDLMKITQINETKQTQIKMDEELKWSQKSLALQEKNFKEVEKLRQEDKKNNRQALDQMEKETENYAMAIYKAYDSIAQHSKSVMEAITHGTLEAMRSMLNMFVETMIKKVIAEQTADIAIASMEGAITFGAALVEIAPIIAAAGIAMGSLNAIKLESGGIVKRPTFAMIGEAGPEAVVPLSKGGIGSTIIFQPGSIVIGRATAADARRQADEIGDALMSRMRVLQRI